MENGFFDKIEDNTAVRIWSKKGQQEKGDSLAEGYTSELWDFTRIIVIQNNLQDLKEIWGQWDDEIKQLFYCYYGMSEQWVTARIKQKGDCKCIPWRILKDLVLAHPDMKKRVDIFALGIYGLVVFSKALGYIDEAVSDLFDRPDKKVTPILVVLAETFRSLSACRRAGEGRFIGCAQLLLAWFYSHFWKVEKVSYRVFSENYSPLKELAATPRRYDISEEKWMVILQILQDKYVEWRAPWMIPDEILYRCGDFD
ncbi:hypothetical protein Gotur_032187 [Gossypium turneri]